MGRFVVIGGGELSKGETYAIDQEIVSLSGKEKPRTLFIPTASYEPPAYEVSFRGVYEEQLGAEVDVLYLLDHKLSRQEIEAKIKWAQIIYVGGGDTRNMLKVWREQEVDQLLWEAYEADTLLCGLSAGSICWFTYGQSEIECEDSADGYDYVELEALGMLKGFHCPHFNEGRREEEFIKMIQASDLMGIAIDNNCALAMIDGKYRVLTSETGRKAYKVYKVDGEVVKEEIEACDDYKNIEALGIKI